MSDTDDAPTTERVTEIEGLTADEREQYLADDRNEALAQLVDELRRLNENFEAVMDSLANGETPSDDADADADDASGDTDDDDGRYIEGASDRVAERILAEKPADEFSVGDIKIVHKPSQEHVTVEERYSDMTDDEVAAWREFSGKDGVDWIEVFEWGETDSGMTYPETVGVRYDTIQEWSE